MGELGEVIREEIRRKEKEKIETRYHIRFNNPRNLTAEVSKDIIMACQRAKNLFEDGVSFNRKIYVVEVKEKLIKSFE